MNDMSIEFKCPDSKSIYLLLLPNGEYGMFESSEDSKILTYLDTGFRFDIVNNYSLYFEKARYPGSYGS